MRNLLISDLRSSEVLGAESDVSLRFFGLEGLGLAVEHVNGAVGAASVQSGWLFQADSVD